MCEDKRDYQKLPNPRLVILWSRELDVVVVFDHVTNVVITCFPYRQHQRSCCNRDISIPFTPSFLYSTYPTTITPSPVQIQSSNIQKPHPYLLQSTYNHEKFSITIIYKLTNMLRQSIRPAARILARQQLRSAVRFNATAAERAPVDPKISQIVDQISTLTLLETSALVTELKERLNISDIALPAAGAAPVAAVPVEEEVKEVVEEKTIFSIKLDSFDAKSKPKIIKEVKSLLGLSLVESKKFVEAAPKVLKENVAKEDADKIKATLEGLGAKVSLE